MHHGLLVLGGIHLAPVGTDNATHAKPVRIITPNGDVFQKDLAIINRILDRASTVQ